MLFLAGADHGYCEKEKRTRQNNLQSATVSLQVVIGLCKRKETAALKIKAAASNRRVNRAAARRLFSFSVVRQFDNRLFLFLRILSEDYYKIQMLHKYPRCL